STRASTIHARGPARTNGRRRNRAAPLGRTPNPSTRAREKPSSEGRGSGARRRSPGLGDTGAMIEVCVAGATGWTGRALVRGVLDADDLALRSAVARSAAGTDVGVALGGEAIGVPVFGTV